MLEKITIGSVKVDGRIQASFADTYLPSKANHGDLWVVDGVMYVFLGLDNETFGRWLPLTRPQEILKFNQTFESDLWEFELGQDIVLHENSCVIIYDVNDRIYNKEYSTEVSIFKGDGETSVLNKVNIKFAEPLSGKAYIFKDNYNTFSVNELNVGMFGNFQVSKKNANEYEVTIKSSNLYLDSNGLFKVKQIESESLTATSSVKTSLLTTNNINATDIYQKGTSLYSDVNSLTIIADEADIKNSKGSVITFADSLPKILTLDADNQPKLDTVISESRFLKFASEANSSSTTWKAEILSLIDSNKTQINADLTTEVNRAKSEESRIESTLNNKIDTRITNVINAAPAALDTLKELADSIGDDANFAATVTNALALKAPLANPNLTGIPTVPNMVVGTNTTQIANAKFVNDTIASSMVSGNSATAEKLQTARTISISTDATGTVSFDGSSNVTIPLTLSDSGVTADTYTKLTVDSKGRVTGGTNPTTISGYAITDAYTKEELDGFLALKSPSESPTFTGTPTAPTAAMGTNTSQLANTTFVQTAISGQMSGNSASATKLQTVRTISVTGDATGTTTFDGTSDGNITMTLSNSGVISGDYTKVTVDSKGRVISGSNPSTISTYGITDAYTKTETESKDTTVLNTAKSYTDTKVTALVNSAPGVLDTLKELADAIGDDPNFAVTITNNLSLKAPLSSPALTGTPTAPTAAADTNTTQIATTEFVSGAVSTAVAGNVASATKLATGRTISVIGDVTYTSGSFDGTTNVTGTATLANSGVTAGSYGSSTAVPTITVDAKGRVTAVSTNSISGSLTFTGDVTGTGSTGASTSLTLANSGVTAGSYGSSTAVPTITVDAKGRVTSISTASVTVPTKTSQLTNDSGYAAGSFLALTGGTLSGNLGMNGASSSDGQLNISTPIDSSYFTGISLTNAFGTWRLANNVPNQHNDSFFVARENTQMMSFSTVQGDIYAGTWGTNKILHSGNFNAYSPTLTGTGASGTWPINVTGSSASCIGNSATTSQRTFSNVRTDGINRGSYGSVSIAGNSNGWMGIDFTDYSATFMVNSARYSGMYKDDNAWVWSFDGDGVLDTGTVPWAKVSNKPTTRDSYGISDIYNKSEIGDFISQLNVKINLIAGVDIRSVGYLQGGYKDKNPVSLIQQYNTLTEISTNVADSGVATFYLPGFSAKDWGYYTYASGSSYLFRKFTYLTRASVAISSSLSYRPGVSFYNSGISDKIYTSNAGVFSKLTTSNDTWAQTLTGQWSCGDEAARQQLNNKVAGFVFGDTTSVYVYNFSNDTLINPSVTINANSYTAGLNYKDGSKGYIIGISATSNNKLLLTDATIVSASTVSVFTYNFGETHCLTGESDGFAMAGYNDTTGKYNLTQHGLCQKFSWATEATTTLPDLLQPQSSGEMMQGY